MAFHVHDRRNLGPRSGLADLAAYSGHGTVARYRPARSVPLFPAPCPLADSFRHRAGQWRCFLLVQLYKSADDPRIGIHVFRHDAADDAGRSRHAGMQSGRRPAFRSVRPGQSRVLLTGHHVSGPAVHFLSGREPHPLRPADGHLHDLSVHRLVTPATVADPPRKRR